MLNFSNLNDVEFEYLCKDVISELPEDIVIDQDFFGSAVCGREWQLVGGTILKSNIFLNGNSRWTDKSPAGFPNPAGLFM